MLDNMPTRFPVKPIYWFSVLFGYGVSFAFVLGFGVEPTNFRTMGIGSCFAVLIGLYHFHLKRCGLSLFEEYFTFGDPTRAKLVKIKWTDIKSYDFCSVADWHRRSFFRRINYWFERSDLNLIYGNDKILQVYLKDGSYFALPPVYVRHEDLIADLRVYLKTARTFDNAAK